MFENGLNVRYAQDFRELEQIISTYSDNHPKERIMFGFGISAHTVKEGRLATRTDLDKITSRPLIIEKYDGHAAVANSALHHTQSDRRHMGRLQSSQSSPADIGAGCIKNVYELGCPPVF
jgi:predicted amidohydrolase YtcJ